MNITDGIIWSDVYGGLKLKKNGQLSPKFAYFSIFAPDTSIVQFKYSATFKRPGGN